MNSQNGLKVVMMLKKAFKKIPNNTNLTLHSDQGWQYQMKNISIY
jgi:phosphohistidine swiveling domain-containing protein